MTTYADLQLRRAQLLGRLEEIPGGPEGREERGATRTALEHVEHRLATHPGRTDAEGLKRLLIEAAEAHHAAEKRLPEHDWQDWYAAYMAARLEGVPESAARERADRYVYGTFVT